MRAAVLRQGEIVLAEVAEPTPGPGQVLVRSLANGICGSDLHVRDMIRGAITRSQEAGNPPPPMPALVLGHEFCAEVVDYGPGTEKVHAVGARVCSMPFVDLADGPAGLGSRPDLPGALGEFMVLDAKRLLPVPGDLSSELASLAEPLAVGARAVATASRGGGEGPYVVIGCGPIGLAVVTALRAAGKGPIVASDFSATRRKIAEVLGADIVVDPAEGSPFESFAGLGYEPSPASTFLPAGMEPKRATIFECVGAPGVLQSILAGAPRHSHIVVAGLCFGEDTFQPLLAINNELLIDFVMCYRPEEFEQTLRSIADGKVDVSPILTDVVGLDRAAWAFDALADGTHAKVVIRPTD